MFRLYASLLAADFAHLGRDIRAAETAGVDGFHLDIMDGHFVPAISFGTAFVQTVRSLTTLPLDIHLMVDDSLPCLAPLAEIEVQGVTVHAEAAHPDEALRILNDRGIPAGLALNPETPPQTVLPFLPLLDHILVMTVQPGRGGQTYLAASTEKIAQTRRLLQANGSGAAIQVDGGICPATLPMVLRAGASAVIAGSAVYGGDPARNVPRLRALDGGCGRGKTI